MAEIKDVVIEDGHNEVEGIGSESASLPSEEFPGYAVGYPTCSEPTRTNRGCDAWNKCGTKGEGPYTVMFLNPKGRKSATHCRNWMYKLQYKQALGYRPIDDEWMECTESVAEDPLDILRFGTIWRNSITRGRLSSELLEWLWLLMRYSGILRSRLRIRRISAALNLTVSITSEIRWRVWNLASRGDVDKENPGQ